MFEPLRPRASKAAPPAESAAPDTVTVAPAHAEHIGETVDDGAQPIRRLDAADIVEAVHAEAVRLAADACGRALRDTVKRSPIAIRSFVRDAMAAAGYPSDARVLVSVDDLPAALGSALRVDGDAALSRGSVRLETADGSLHASLADRAALLVGSAR